MAKRVKVTPKELKKPDKFREAIGNAAVFLSENYKKILLALVAIVLVLVGISAVRVALEENKLEASSRFNDAVESYTGGNREEALEKFSALTEENPDADISKIALYYAATINYEMGKYDESISLFDKFLESDVESEMLKDSARLTLGLASFNKGEWQKAIDSLSKLDTDGSPYENQAKLHIGLSLEKLGKFGEAEKVYRELLSDYSNDTEF